MPCGDKISFSISLGIRYLRLLLQFHICNGLLQAGIHNVSLKSTNVIAEAHSLAGQQPQQVAQFDEVRPVVVQFELERLYAFLKQGLHHLANRMLVAQERDEHQFGWVHLFVVFLKECIKSV